MNLKKKVSSLYALFDYELNHKEQKTLEEFVAICKKNNAQIIQYRDKINPIDIQKENLLTLRKLWNKTLIINDNIQLCKFCDGLHLGQDDIAKFSLDKKEAIAIIRDKIGSKILGISTHNESEILETNTLDIDYIGLGAYAKTTTKKDIKNVISKQIEQLTKISTKDVAIIGGVKLSDKIDFARYKVVGSDLYR